VSSEDQGFEIRLRKNFGHGRNQRISRNFTKFRPKFIFRLFLKILLNIFKLLFPKFLNFGGGRNQRISRNFAENWWGSNEKQAKALQTLLKRQKDLNGNRERISTTRSSFRMATDNSLQSIFFAYSTHWKKNQLCEFKHIENGCIRNFWMKHFHHIFISF